MANIMSMKQVRNKPSRDGFDLSFTNRFTAKVGELLPIFTKECLPGDSFKINPSWFTRTQPINSAAYGRLREYVDFYFVPYHLLWSYFPDWITQMDDAQFAFSNNSKVSLSSNCPYTTDSDLQAYLLQYTMISGTEETRQWIPDANPDGNSKMNMWGYNRGALSNKLLQYLGYGQFLTNTGKKNGNFSNVRLSLWRLLAYQKICQDWFRPQQWQSSQSWLFNVNYLRDSKYTFPSTSYQNIIDLQYALYKKDYFTGLLPKAQFGDESFLNLDGAYEITPIEDDLSTVKAGQSFYAGFTGSTYTDYSPGGVSILALRKAQALQKWKEVSQCADKSYRAQMEKHFGAKVRGVSDHLCTHIGGTSSSINISPVVNNNLIDGSADIKGMGTGGSNGQFNFDCHEHGIIMGIYRCVPDVDYFNILTDKHNTKVQNTDYAIPEFDKVGMQPTYFYEYYGLQYAGTDVSMGYAPRYIEYKTSVDVVNGAFVDSLKNYVIPKNSLYDESLTQAGTISILKSFYVNPKVVNNIFNVAADSHTDTDELLVDANLQCYAVRDLDSDGLPY